MSLREIIAELQAALDKMTYLEATPARDANGRHARPFSVLREETIKALCKCFKDCEALPSLLQPVWRDEVPKEVADLRTALDLMARRIRGSRANGWCHPISLDGGAPTEVVDEFTKHHGYAWKMVRRLTALSGLAPTLATPIATPPGTSFQIIPAILSQEWLQANEELDRPPAHDEIGRAAVEGMLIPALRDRMMWHWPTISALRVMGGGWHYY